MLSYRHNIAPTGFRKTFNRPGDLLEEANAPRGGAKPKFDVLRMVELQKAGLSSGQIANELHCTRNTVMGALKRYKDKQAA